MTPPARIAAAIELLESVDAAARRPADAVANDFFRERRFIGSGDRRAVSDRAWRVLRARRRLGWWLERARAIPNPRLLVAASLLLEGWTVDGLRETFAPSRYGPPPLLEVELIALRPLEFNVLNHAEMPAAVRAEIPDWILPALLARFGDALPAEMDALSEPAPLDLRVNTLKTTREQARAALRAENIETEPTPYSPWGLRIPTRVAVTTGGAFQAGLVEIQDEGSQLVAALVGAAPGMRVADWCAGAGGKTLALAMTMSNRGHIVAADVSAPRLDGAVRRLRRAGVHNVERHLSAAGDKWAKRHARSFDRVLVDAPCTGSGTWRRNPDGRLRLQAVDLAELRVKQAGILDEAARLAKPGGRLVYATCSLLADENEAQVEGFLDRHPDYGLIALTDAWNLPGAPPCEGPYLSLTPLRHNTDGFFAAILQRQ